jgi:hypothetical protein
MIAQTPANTSLTREPASSSEQFEEDVPLFMSHFPPSRDGGAGLTQALQATDEHVLIKEHVIDTWDSDCVAIVTNRRLAVGRLTSLGAVLIAKLPKRLIGKVPVGGEVVNGIIDLVGWGVGKLTNSEQRRAARVAATDERAMLSPTSQYHGLLNIDYRELCTKFSEVTLRRHRWLVAGPPALDFSARRLFGSFGLSDLRLPSETHFAIYKAYAHFLRPYLESRGAKLEIEDNTITLKLPPVG